MIRYVFVAQENGCFGGSLDFYRVYFGDGVKYARIIDYLSIKRTYNKRKKENNPGSKSDFESK